MLVAGAAIVAAWAATAALPPPWRGAEQRVVDAAFAPIVATVVALTVALVAGLVVGARRSGAAPTGTIEEPLPVACALPRLGASVPVVAVAGVEPGCGASTLAFNLAVALTAGGIVPARGEAGRRPRPACVLAEGPLSAALGLSPRAVEEPMGDRPYRAAPDLVNAGVRHASGAALFCVRRGETAPARLRTLLEQLRGQFDAVVVDAALTERDVVHLAADLCDLLLLIAQPSSVEATGRWVERVWDIGLEARTGLLLTRVCAWPEPPREQRLAFLHRAEIPGQPQVETYDRRGVPWVLDTRLGAARSVLAIVRQVFPALMDGADDRAA